MSTRGPTPRTDTGPASAVCTDRQLWERLRDADAEALTLLFHRHSEAVYNFAFRRTSSWDLAEDVVQATYIALWRRARAARIDRLSLDTARPVLLVMAGHECSNVWRASRRRAAVVSRIEAVDQDWVTPDHAAAAAARIDDERAMSDVRRLLDRIPAKQRDAVELVIWSGCSIAEAALALGVPEGTVKSRLMRARARLAGLIDIDHVRGLA